MSHHDIWQAVDRLADLHELSPSALAKKAGLDATTFNKSKRVMNDGKLRWPSTESIMRVLDATKTNWDEFVTLMSEENTTKALPNAHISLLPFNEAAKTASFNAVGSPHGDAWDDIAFPNIHTNAIFALELNDNDHAPLYRENDRLIIDPQAQLRKGDRVFIRTSHNATFLQEVVRQTVKNIEVKDLITQALKTFTMEEITVIGRIMWVSQ